MRKEYVCSYLIVKRFPSQSIRSVQCRVTGEMGRKKSEISCPKDAQSVNMCAQLASGDMIHDITGHHGPESFPHKIAEGEIGSDSSKTFENLRD